MADAWMDADGLTSTQRRYLVDQARANLRLRDVEQSSELYRPYEQYVAGVYSRGELWVELDKRRRDRTRKSTTL